MPKTSKSSSTKSKKKSSAPLSADFAVGHHPSQRGSLTPHDGELFRAFQSNLLSLISHELRTPLMGIINSLSMLSEGAVGEDTKISFKEVSDMAFRNAQRLNHALSSLLDLAALESGTFHVKLREVDLSRLCKGVTVALEPVARLRGITIAFLKEDSRRGVAQNPAPVLADPQKLGRALGLALELATSRGDLAKRVAIDCNHSEISVEFELKSGGGEEWDRMWTESLVGFEGRSQAPLSLFIGISQGEAAFLSREEEGLGSELLLIHEILRLHGGKLEQRRKDTHLTLSLSLPELDSLEGVKRVLQSRADQISLGIGSVALALIRVPSGIDVEEFRAEMKSKLFRTTDAVYPLPAENELALVMDDCSPTDAVRLLERVEASLEKSLQYGVVVYPNEAGDVDLLLEIARERVEKSG